MMDKVKIPSYYSSMVLSGVQDWPRKFVLYGPPKEGKSTLAASAEQSFLIYTEDRVSHIDVKKPPEVVRSMEEVFGWLNFVANSNGEFKNLIIDTVDWLEPLLHDYICRQNKWESLHDNRNPETNYQQGIKIHAVAGWRSFLAQLDWLRKERGMSITLVFHSAITKVDPPDSQSYDKEVMKIDKNALAVIEEWADIIGFYKTKVYVTKGEKGGKVSGGDQRILHLGGSNPAFISGNSYGLDAQREVNLDQTREIMDYILKGKGE